MNKFEHVQGGMAMEWSMYYEEGSGARRVFQMKKFEQVQVVDNTYG